MKNLSLFLFSFFLLLGFTQPAFAHVSVKPNEAGIASFQTFSVGVPNERGMPTTQVRLAIPDGLEHVSPNVKPGWNIEIKKSEVSSDNSDTDEHTEGQVTEIIWSGGSIPEGQRDDFLFSAKVPAEETTLVWKAYQTYENGDMVAWEIESDDKKPKNDAGEEDFSQFGPASTTKIINDLKNDTEVPASNKTSSQLPLYVSMIAIILAVYTLWNQMQKTRTKKK